LDDVPNEQGVHRLHEDGGEVVYVGRGRMRARVAAHLANAAASVSATAENSPSSGRPRCRSFTAPAGVCGQTITWWNYSDTYPGTETDTPSKTARSFAGNDEFLAYRMTHRQLHLLRWWHVDLDVNQECDLQLRHPPA
jgi:hypothetical protein